MASDIASEGAVNTGSDLRKRRSTRIVQAVPLGLAWSNLPLCHSFVVMVHEWLWYLTEPSLAKRNLPTEDIREEPLTLEDTFIALTGKY